MERLSHAFAFLASAEYGDPYDVFNAADLRHGTSKEVACQRLSMSCFAESSFYDDSTDTQVVVMREAAHEPANLDVPSASGVRLKPSLPAVSNIGIASTSSTAAKGASSTVYPVDNVFLIKVQFSACRYFRQKNCKAASTENDHKFSRHSAFGHTGGGYHRLRYLVGIHIM